MDRVIEASTAYVGLRSRAFKSNGFGAKAGFDGKPWDGSFLDAMFREAKTSIGVSLVSTTAALAFFHRTNRVYWNPKRGDIAFFAWSTDDDGFGQPHVGLVLDARDWKKNRRFLAVEGQTNSGQPRAHQENDGVYERARFESDVFAFARPSYKTTISYKGDISKTVLRPSMVTFGRSTPQTALLQRALAVAVGASGFQRGTFDSRTRSAVMRFQKECGLISATGVPDSLTLGRLAEATEYQFFHVA